MYLGEDLNMYDQQQYKYMTVEDIKGLDGDNIKLDTTDSSFRTENGINLQI